MSRILNILYTILQVSSGSCSPVNEVELMHNDLRNGGPQMTNEEDNAEEEDEEEENAVNYVY